MIGNRREDRPKRPGRVLAALDRALEEVEPLPPPVLAAAQQLYSWRTFDADLLELLTDSASDGLAVVRAEQPNRMLLFGSGSHVVQLEVVQRGATYELVGFATATDPARVRAEWPGGEMEVDIDGGGAFVIVGVPPGRLRLVVEGPGGDTEHVTPWFDVGPSGTGDAASAHDA